MRPDPVSSWRRRGAMAALWLCGLVALIGSGGGGGGAECSFFSNTCNPTIEPVTPTFTPAVGIDPARVTVLAGSRAVFTALAVGGQETPTFQWQRSADGGVTYADIAGATTSTLALDPVLFADDGTVLRVTARFGGTSVTGLSRLSVSRVPPLVVQDGEFAAGDWIATVVADPATGGPAHSVLQAASGGHPGAYRGMVFSLTAGPSSLRVLHLARMARYDPAQQGALYRVDYGEDCLREAASTSTVNLRAELLLEQAGRHYVPALSPLCASTAWTVTEPQRSLGAADFVLLDGPACGAGEACPDFSPAGAPMRFGYARRASVPAGLAAGTIVHGIDNWTLTLWPR